VDSVTALAFARELIDIDSTTGRERDAGLWLAARLRADGYTVVEQPVDDHRFNVFATLDPPAIVLSTHYDCVPPFFASTVGNARLYGRGACDAKGILAAQVAAAARLRHEGNRQVGLLFVVGEERGSDGAIVANRHAARSKFLVNGEPTGSRLATGTRGVLRVRLNASGRAGHSSAPEHFESAIEKLVDALVQLRTLPLPSAPPFGTTTYSVGLISGGVAPNVVPASASAEVMFRIVGDTGEMLEIVRTLEPLVQVEEVLRVPPVRLHTIPGMPAVSFPFTTDIPLLTTWGTPLLYGPGSFLVAHTDEEHLSLAEFDASIDGYVSIVRALS
jgi:acetylornithine deacetylase